jgi:exodeoxyribonuclease VII small subunit
MKFEEKLAELQKVVESLEGGELALEDALALFERGIGLTRELARQLDEVERKLEVLVRGADGTLERREIEDPGDDE